MFIGRSMTTTVICILGYLFCASCLVPPLLDFPPSATGTQDIIYMQREGEMTLPGCRIQEDVEGLKSEG